MSDQGTSGCAAQYPSVTLFAASPNTMKSRIIARVRRSSKKSLSRDVSLVSCTMRSKACNMCKTRVSSRYSPPAIPLIWRQPPDTPDPQSGARAATWNLPSIQLFAQEDSTALAQSVHIQQDLLRCQTSQANPHRCLGVPPCGHTNQRPKASQPCACLQQHESHHASHVSRPSCTFQCPSTPRIIPNRRAWFQARRFRKMPSGISPAGWQGARRRG